jgi:hypothetical protein
MFDVKNLNVGDILVWKTIGGKVTYTTILGMYGEDLSKKYVARSFLINVGMFDEVDKIFSIINLEEWQEKRVDLEDYWQLVDIITSEKKQ